MRTPRMHSVPMTPDDEKRALGDAAKRIEQRYPGLEPEVIVEMVESRAREFDGRPIRDFVPLLVERGVVSEIESMASSAQVAS
jgi:hypothetical protein